MELTAAAAWLNTTFAAYDRAILSLLHKFAENFGLIATPAMKVITLLGEKGLILILLSLVLMLFAKTRKTGICMFGAIACGAILTNFILKDYVARPRPFEGLELYRQWWRFIGAPAEDGFSFPSGHVTAAVAGLSALCFVRGRKWIIPSVLWVLLMAVSRNYLMAHYPSDVLFAVLVGLVAALIAYLITWLIYHFLRTHRDLPFCSFLLNWSLFGARRDEFDEDEEEDEDDEEDEDFTLPPRTRPAPVAERPAPVVERPAPEPRAVAEKRTVPVVKRSSSGYQGKHLK